MPLVSDSLRGLASALIIGAIIVAGLVLGKDILIPLAVAGLIAFVLSPIINRMVLWRIPRIISVVMTVSIVAALLGFAAFALSTELLSLTASLDGYRGNLVQKIRTLTGRDNQDGLLQKAAKSIDTVSSAIEQEIKDRSPALPSASGDGALPSTSGNGRVVVAQPGAEGSGSQFVGYAGQFSSYLAPVALTVLFTLLLLLQNHDFRDRIVRLAGTDNISTTTEALGDAGRRLSRYLSTQLLINAGFGAVIAGALYANGVPYALLWGMLVIPIRFVPFIGALIASVPPLVLSFAVDPGWLMFSSTAAAFLVVEIITGNVIEPVLLGKSVGLSPFAMIIAASFWTVVWGPVGLLLAAPLTMVLVVFGNYVPGLQFVSVLLGDSPALRPEEEFYHRALSGDVQEATAIAARAVKDGSTDSAADLLILPAFRHAAIDARRGRLDPTRVEALNLTIREVSDVLNLVEADEEQAPVQPAASPEILVLPCRGEIDKAASVYLVDHINTAMPGAATVFGNASGLMALADVRQSLDYPINCVLLVNVGGLDERQIDLIARRAARDFPASAIKILDLVSAGPPGISSEKGQHPRIGKYRSISELMKGLSRGTVTAVDKSVSETEQLEIVAA